MVIIMKPRVAVVSFDYAGTLAGYFDMDTIKRMIEFQEDMQLLQNLLMQIKEIENLERIYFSLNTLENRLSVLEKALTLILDQQDWLFPTIQFLGFDAYRYDTNSKKLSEPITEQFNAGQKNTDKLANLMALVLNISKDETVVSVTHVEDGQDYDIAKLDSLKTIGVDTHIVNLPDHSTRPEMMELLKANIITRKEQAMVRSIH
jgi:hypothetical protein